MPVTGLGVHFYNVGTHVFTHGLFFLSRFELTKGLCWKGFFSGMKDTKRFLGRCVRKYFSRKNQIKQGYRVANDSRLSKQRIGRRPNPRFAIESGNILLADPG